MKSHRILSFDRGVLYLKLGEVCSISNMHVSSTLARISRDEIEVVKADSKGEVSSTKMVLSAEEASYLNKGMWMVKEWWNHNPLGEKCVLLECGHVYNWNELEEEQSAPDAYESPSKGRICWCSECENTYAVYRYMPEHFGEKVML